MENGSLDDTVEQQRLGTVSVRIMVHEWPLASSSDLQLIVIQEEVTEIDGRQVRKNNTLLVLSSGEAKSSHELKGLHVCVWWSRYKACNVMLVSTVLRDMA